MYISCIFHVVCASFSALATLELADAKADFSGMRALRNAHLAELLRLASRAFENNTGTPPTGSLSLQ